MNHPWFQVDLPNGALELNDHCIQQQPDGPGFQSLESITAVINEARTGPFLSEHMRASSLWFKHCDASRLFKTQSRCLRILDVYVHKYLGRCQNLRCSNVCVACKPSLWDILPSPPAPMKAQKGARKLLMCFTYMGFTPVKFFSKLNHFCLDSLTQQIHFFDNKNKSFLGWSIRYLGENGNTGVNFTPLQSFKYSSISVGVGPEDSRIFGTSTATQDLCFVHRMPARHIASYRTQWCVPICDS